MTQIKRKSDPTSESFLTPKRLAGNEEPPSKRLRKVDHTSNSLPVQKSLKSALSGTKLQTEKNLIVKEEESLFPRGGASVLTPLEHKQIQIEATRDALFEQQNVPSGKHARFDEDDNLAIGDSPAKKGRPKVKVKKGTKGSNVEDEFVKIVGLGYKRLAPGSLVLGQVSQINAHDIALALPNNLTGYVPITSVSDKLTERVEKNVTLEPLNDVNQLEDDDDIDPRTFFFIGQYLRAMVVSTSNEPTNRLHEKGKRRIELSLRPQDANSGITRTELIPHSMVMASVISVEDHGVIMDLGLSDAGVRGFMSSKETGYGTEFSTLKEGTVFLCMINGLSSSGSIVKLSADIQKIAKMKKTNYLAEGPTINAFLPGTAVELLVTEVTSRGIAGKIMGMIDVTADLTHSGFGTTKTDVMGKYKIGAKTKGRIICTFPTAQHQKLGISFLDHVMSFSSPLTQQNGSPRQPLEVTPLSAIVEEVIVKKVEPGVGLWVDIGMKDVPGFVHISRISDRKIDTLPESSGPYKVGSIHRGRVIGYNSLDGLYLLSLEMSILNQAFLRIDDLKISELVKGTVVKLIINSSGVGGLLVALADGITGLVPEMHMADVSLLHPEKKFKEGMKVTARVLSTDPAKRKIRLTLKKTLVNSEARPMTSYTDITKGMQSPGTIVNITPSGAVVQFYGIVRGFLPVSEMSESYIQDPNQHFRVGQVINVHVLTVDVDSRKLTVSCKDVAFFGAVQQNAFKALKVGELVSVTVTGKSKDGLRVELIPSGLHGILPIGHLTDTSESKNVSTLEKIRVGQTLQNLVVLEKIEQNHFTILTNKPSIAQAVKGRTFVRDFDDVKEGALVHGFINNITENSIFVQFGNRLTGLLPKAQLLEELLHLPDFGYKRFDSVTVTVLAVDYSQRRFLLSMKTVEFLRQGESGASILVSNPLDEAVKYLHDFSLGKKTYARIASIKETQINVQLADNVQGRIDVSEVFDLWGDIKDRKQPLRIFSPKQIVPVRILGIHDARNHRFLPITHRAGKTPVFELSAKPSAQADEKWELLALDKVAIGTLWIAFVNNIGRDCLWVNLSPNVRGRIRALDISDDVSLIKDLEKNFPVGSAIRVRVTDVDVANHRLDLSARISQPAETLKFQNLSKDMVVPGKVTRVNERQIMIQLSDSVSGPVNLTDLADDFSQVNPTIYSKNDIVRVCVTEIDIPNKRIRLSTRPSRILNSALPVVDREITSVSELEVNDVVRGFVKSVANNGLFINLGGTVTAYVRVSDLSDSYLKDWKDVFQVDQLVKGKVVTINSQQNHVRLSLKSSILDKNYIPPITFSDLKVGQVITGRIRKVEDFGVFIVIDGSTNVSGLCHKTEMAEGKVDNVKKLYEEGDQVKAKILKLEADKKRVSFGLRASYFEFESDDDESIEENGLEGPTGVMLKAIMTNDEEIDEENGIVPNDAAGLASTSGHTGVHFSDRIGQDFTEENEITALDPGGFDWTLSFLSDTFRDPDRDLLEVDMDGPSKKRSRNPIITIDRTGELDAKGPRSPSDFERLLIGQPNSSRLWIEYMAFQVGFNELAKARDVAERAIRTIDIREDIEKMNVWIALLNLENAYGNNDTLAQTFKRACLYNDPQEIHERLTSIYIQSGNHDKADEAFQTLIKKFSQSPTVWYNYAHFLHQTLSSPGRARLLLPRAIQSLPSHTHVNLTIKFAALEFNSSNGSPERGRTMFEGVLSTFPRRLDLWNQLLDLEFHQGDESIVRALFERAVKVKGLKPRGAKAWFKRWSEWEENNGDANSQAKVRAKAQEWVKTMAGMNK